MQVIFLNLVSKAVNHKSLGAGRIVAQTATIVTVQFGEKQMKFSFPSIFREIMTIEDATLQREINELCETESYAINRQKEELLLSYEKERHLEKEDYRMLYYRLAYPEKFWKIANFYYNSGKAWIPEKYQEKLLKVNRQEQEKKEFLKKFREKYGILTS